MELLTIDLFVCYLVFSHIKTKDKIRIVYWLIYFLYLNQFWKLNYDYFLSELFYNIYFFYAIHFFV